MAILNPQPRGIIPGTTHFYWSEFLAGGGDRRIRAVTRGNQHYTAEQVRDNIQNVAVWLQRLRNAAEKKYPGMGGVHITSGFRPPEVNKAVGGASMSYHISGQAADFRILGVTLPQTIDLLLQIEFPGGIGVNTKANFIHVDLGNKRAFTYGNPRDAALVQQINQRRSK